MSIALCAASETARPFVPKWVFPVRQKGLSLAAALCGPRIMMELGQLTGAKGKESRNWKHKINISALPKIACEVCGQNLNSEDSLETHMETNHYSILANESCIELVQQGLKAKSATETTNRI